MCDTPAKKASYMICDRQYINNADNHPLSTYKAGMAQHYSMLVLADTFAQVVWCKNTMQRLNRSQIANDDINDRTPGDLL